MADETKPTGTQRYADWKRKVERCKDRRVMWEAKVATCMHFSSGNHKVSWDDKGMMRVKQLADNEIFRPVNYFPSALSILSARMVSSDLRWNPSKTALSDVTDEEVDAADAALQFAWEGDKYGDFSVKQENKIVVRHGFLQSGRLVYFHFDHDADMPVMDSFSLWDVFSDAPQKLKDKRWLVIACSKSLDWVKENEDFDSTVRNSVALDQRLAESGLHEQYLQKQMGSAALQNSDSTMLYYCFSVMKGAIPKNLQDEYNTPEEPKEDIPMPDEEELTEDELAKEKEEEPDKKNKRWIKYEVCCPQGVLQEGALDYPRLSAIFDNYKPVEDGMFYGDPPAYDWIDPSKSIDKTNSNIENYIETFLHGRWILRNKKIPRPVAGRGGQVAYDETGNSIKQLELQPLPSTTFQHKADAIAHFERVSGVHDASVGGQTRGIEAGVAMAQQMAADEQNTSDSMDNYRMFLQRCGKKILRQMADNWSDVRVLYRFDQKTMESQPMNVIGERYAKTGKDNEEAALDGAVAIRPFEQLQVELEVGVFWKKSERRNQIIELLKTGWSPGGNPIMDRVILSSFEIGVGREMVRELKELQNPYAYIVEGNAMLIMQGEAVELNQNDPHEFFWNFYAGKAQEQLKAGNQRAATMLNAQAQQHAILMKQGLGSTGDPQAPEDLGALDALQGTEGGLPGQRTIVQA